MTNFATIPGYAREKDQLIALAKNAKIPHAQLFWGAPGTLLLPMAWAYLTYLYCTNQANDNACGSCNNCKKMGRFVHPDVRCSFPIASSNPSKSAPSDATSKVFLASWHDFMQSQPYGDILGWRQQLGIADKPLLIPRAEAVAILHYLPLPPLEAPYKVVLIWLPEYFHPTAAHALLKTIEEPPSYVRFLLVSEAPEKILLTLRSRLQPYHIPPLSQASIREWLSKTTSLSFEKIAEIASLSEGNWQRVQALLAGEDAPLLEEFTTWMRFCYTHDIPKLLSMLEKWLAKSREEQKDFFRYGVHIMQQSMWCRWLLTQPNQAIQTAEKMLAQKLSLLLDDAAIRQITQWMGESHYGLERNAHSRILFLNFSLQMVQLFSSVREQQHKNLR